MGLVVALVMGVSGALITQRQQEAMMGQVTDNGASLVRFIAAQNALAALSEDWPMVDVAVGRYAARRRAMFRSKVCGLSRSTAMSRFRSSARAVASSSFSSTWVAAVGGGAVGRV